MSDEVSAAKRIAIFSPVVESGRIRAQMRYFPAQTPPQGVALQLLSDFAGAAGQPAGRHLRPYLEDLGIAADNRNPRLYPLAWNALYHASAQTARLHCEGRDAALIDGQDQYELILAECARARELGPDHFGYREHAVQAWRSVVRNLPDSKERDRLEERLRRAVEETVLDELPMYQPSGDDRLLSGETAIWKTALYFPDKDGSPAGYPVEVRSGDDIRTSALNFAGVMGARTRFKELAEEGTPTCEDLANQLMLILLSESPKLAEEFKRLLESEQPNESAFLAQVSKTPPKVPSSARLRDELGKLSAHSMLTTERLSAAGANDHPVLLVGEHLIDGELSVGTDDVAHLLLNSFAALQRAVSHPNTRATVRGELQELQPFLGQTLNGMARVAATQDSHLPGGPTATR